jgi:hypothetical protein
VSGAAGAALRDPATLDYFARLVQRTSPKSYKEAAGEVSVLVALEIDTDMVFVLSL